MTYTRKRQNLKTKRRNPKSRITKRHKKKTNRRKRGGDINPCYTAILSKSINNPDIKAYSEHLCEAGKSLELLKKTTSNKTHETCADFLTSPEPQSNCTSDTCKNITDCINYANHIYTIQKPRLNVLINTNMKTIEDNLEQMFTLLKENKFDFNKESVQDYLYAQIDDVTSINLFNKEKNDSCKDNESCVDSQKIFLTIVISHLRFYKVHDLNNEKQRLLTMISKNANAIKTIIQYHMNDNSLKESLTLLQQEVPALKQ